MYDILTGFYWVRALGTNDPWWAAFFDGQLVYMPRLVSGSDPSAFEWGPRIEPPPAPVVPLSTAEDTDTWPIRVAVPELRVVDEKLGFIEGALAPVGKQGAAAEQLGDARLAIRWAIATLRRHAMTAPRKPTSIFKNQDKRVLQCATCGR